MFRVSYKALTRSSAGVAAALALMPHHTSAQEIEPESAIDNQSAALEEITVTGRAQTYYRVDESAIGTKTNTPFLEIPQSVQVLSRQLIEDQAARQTTDLYRSISGVSKFSYSGVTFRGFRQDEIRYDGVEGDPFGGFAIPQLFNIERVEVLKGPTGMLYGGGQPGGLINYITKKPQTEQQSKVITTVGNFGLYGVSGEYTGAVGAAERVRVRLGGFFESKEPFRANTKDENVILDAGLEFVPSPSTSLLAQLTYVDQTLSANRLRGVPADDDGNFLTDIRWNHNEPTDFQRLEALVGLGRLSHDFGGGLSGILTFRYLENQRTQNYHEPRGLVDLDGDGNAESMRREFRDQSRENEDWSLTADLIYDTFTGSISHTLLFGGDYLEQSSDSVFRTAQRADNGGPVPDLNLFNPVYGLTSGTNYDIPNLAPRIISGEVVRWGVYAQDQIDLTERLIAVVGARYDDYKDTDRTTGETFNDGAVTLRGGLIFKPRDDFSVYANYSEGFQPQNLGNQDAPNGPFSPEKGEQIEAGIKTELMDGRFQTGAAVYRIVKSNVLQPDPTPGLPTGVLASIGEVRSQGFEIDFAGDLTANWVLTANYAYNDAKITDDAGSTAIRNSVGDQFANAPKHTLGVWTRYDFPALNSAIAGGMDFVDDRLSLSGQMVKSYAIFDVSWQTEWRNLNFQLNVKNVFDKEYAESGFLERTGHFPGEPRTVVFQVSAAL